jgi:hypothetical protein
MLSILFLIVFFHSVHGHGFLCDPPSRNAAWMCGFPKDEPKNYDQMAMNAGGVWRMYPNYPQSSPRYYGVCGDYAFGPQDHAAGGIHDRGVRKTYCQGSTVNIQVNITAYHKGFFEFQLCPTYPETETCFKTFHKHSIEGTAIEGGQPSYSIPITLPFIECNHCVFRWVWTTNNSPGLPPEMFINCADIQII